MSKEYFCFCNCPDFSPHFNRQRPPPPLDGRFGVPHLRVRYSGVPSQGTNGEIWVPGNPSDGKDSGSAIVVRIKHAETSRVWFAYMAPEGASVALKQSNKSSMPYTTIFLPSSNGIWKGLWCQFRKSTRRVYISSNCKLDRGCPVAVQVVTFAQMENYSNVK